MASRLRISASLRLKREWQSKRESKRLDGVEGAHLRLTEVDEGVAE